MALCLRNVCFGPCRHQSETVQTWNFSARLAAKALTFHHLQKKASTTLALDDRGRIVTGLTGLNLHGGRCRLSLCHPFPRPFCLHGQLEFLICLLLHRY